MWLACWWSAALTWLMLFTFQVFERSCFSLFRMTNQPDFSLKPLFIVDYPYVEGNAGIRVSCHWLCICANVPFSMNASRSAGRVSNTAVKSGRCRPYLSESKEAWAWMRIWTQSSSSFWLHKYFESESPPFPWRTTRHSLFFWLRSCLVVLCTSMDYTMSSLHRSVWRRTVCHRLGFRGLAGTKTLK